METTILGFRVGTGLETASFCLRRVSNIDPQHVRNRPSSLWKGADGAETWKMNRHWEHAGRISRNHEDRGITNCQYPFEVLFEVPCTILKMPKNLEP